MNLKLRCWILRRSSEILSLSRNHPQQHLSVASNALVIQRPACLLRLTPQAPQDRITSSRTSYHLPRRKRQGSFTSSLVLSPQSCALRGPLRCGCAFCERFHKQKVCPGFRRVSIRILCEPPKNAGYKADSFGCPPFAMP